MNLATFNFPDLADTDIAFSTLRADPVLLEEAKKRGFYGANTPYNDLFHVAFFRGVKITYRQDIDLNFKHKASRYLRALMGSFSLKHEDKEAICAMLLSELVEVSA